LIALGCRPETVHVVGSLKFESPRDLDERTLDVPRLLRHAGMPEGARVILGGSTHEGEEAILAEIFRRLRKDHPDLYLILVPRHFERSKSVGSQLDRQGLRYIYRSEINFTVEPTPGSTEGLVVNSTGELRHFYPHASLVFMGKSLEGRGGQNPIEPAAAGRAILFGPHMQNFPDIVTRFLEAHAAVQVADARELERQLDALLRDGPRRETLGRNALRVVEANRGALERTVNVVLHTLADHGLEPQ